MVSANSATVLIPVNKIWWAWSDELSDSHNCSLTFAIDLDPLNDTCGSALNISLSDSASTGFRIYAWRFEEKTTPLLNPENFEIDSSFMRTYCSNLPCQTGSISSSSDYYYVLAIKNFNTGSQRINFTVPWHIDCDPNNANNSTSSNIPSSTLSSSSSSSTPRSSSKSSTPSSSSNDFKNNSSSSSYSPRNFGVTTLVILVTIAALLILVMQHSTRFVQIQEADKYGQSEVWYRQKTVSRHPNLLPYHPWSGPIVKRY
ncbi:20_t:CDS:2 [Diversispora eburnea]|uniref:20_t:CDS:1 n=1 Tax=Diversispora eburnea TaxID=1213867 RepID=A0A9N9C3I8_9GLOM|nr:20_t:CDS:2 [Diversispora eburnea]